MKLKFKIKIPKIPKWLKITLASLFICGICGLFFCVYCNAVIGKCAEKCYDDINSLPERDVGLLLGAAKIAPSGRPNQYFAGRVETAARLYHAGKIRHILISGDNGRKDYDEPTDMRDELLKLGVPENAMTRDFAGFRTLDSVVRAKAVFKCSRFTVISQQFHAVRAIYLAEKHGIDAIGFAAAEPSWKWLVMRNRRREKYARIAAWLDVNILHRQPKFYGPEEPLNIQK